MKIIAVTITYNRPQLLGRLIHCFERQTLPIEQRELVVLDDAGQYPMQPSGNGWRVVSVPERYPSLGAKRNAAVRLISDDSDAIAVFDDDDFYSPTALAACCHALERGEWAQARQILEWDGRGDGWRRQFAHRTESPDICAYHGAWSFRRSAFEAVGGYPEVGEEDNPLMRKLLERFGPSVDTICAEFPNPWYVYSRGRVNGMRGAPKTYHVSDTYQRLVKRNAEFHTAAWEEIGAQQSGHIKVVETIPVGWDRDYAAIPIPERIYPRPW